VTTTVGDRVFPARYDVRALAGAAPPTAPEAAAMPTEPQRSWWQIALLVAISVLTLVIGGLWWRRRGDQEPEEIYQTFGDSSLSEEPMTPAASVPSAPDLAAMASPQESSAAAYQPAAAEAPAGRALQLVVVHGRTSGHSYELVLRDRCVVGTAEGNDLLLNEEGLESHHFELSLEDRKVWIHDLTRARKTSVNGVPIAGPFQLERGDLILAGRTELRVVFKER